VTDITQAQLERNKRLDYAGPKDWAKELGRPVSTLIALTPQNETITCDWPAVGNAALIMMATAGVIDADVLMPVDTIDHWAAPSWRTAAIDYHRHRPAGPVIAAKQLARLRWLLSDDISLERAWGTLNYSKRKY
jgi:hypothetical protein